MFGFSKKKETEQPKSKDALVIEQLKAHNSDLTKPHAIDFFLYMPDEAAAQSFMTVLEQNGYEAGLGSHSDDGTTCVQAKKTVVPTAERMERLSTELEMLAARYGGDYDGWGTEIVE